MKQLHHLHKYIKTKTKDNPTLSYIFKVVTIPPEYVTPPEDEDDCYKIKKNSVYEVIYNTMKEEGHYVYIDKVSCKCCEGNGEINMYVRVLGSFHIDATHQLEL